MKSLTPEPLVSKNSIIVIAKDQVSADLAGEAVILNLKSGIYYGLDAVGSRVWELVQSSQRLKDILDVILTEYDVEAERCERDLLALLQQMANNGLVEIKDETDQ